MARRVLKRNETAPDAVVDRPEASPERAPEPPIRPEVPTDCALTARGPTDPEPTEPSAMDEIRALLTRAQGGDAAALPGLREIFDARPDVWTWLSDLAQHAEESWIGVIGGTDLGLAEALRRRAATLKVELVGPKPTAIERLLAERVVATWLYTNWADAMVARVSAPEASASTRLLAFAEARAERAQRRHAEAPAARVAIDELIVPDVAPTAGAAVLVQPSAPQKETNAVLAGTVRPVRLTVCASLGPLLVTFTV